MGTIVGWYPFILVTNPNQLFKLNYYCSLKSIKYYGYVLNNRVNWILFRHSFL